MQRAKGGKGGAIRQRRFNHRNPGAVAGRHHAVFHQRKVRANPGAVHARHLQRLPVREFPDHPAVFGKIAVGQGGEDIFGLVVQRQGQVQHVQLIFRRHVREDVEDHGVGFKGPQRHAVFLRAGDDAAVEAALRRRQAFDGAGRNAQQQRQIGGLHLGPQQRWNRPGAERVLQPVPGNGRQNFGQGRAIGDEHQGRVGGQRGLQGRFLGGTGFDKDGRGAVDQRGQTVHDRAVARIVQVVGADDVQHLIPPCRAPEIALGKRRSIGRRAQHGAGFWRQGIDLVAALTGGQRGQGRDGGKRSDKADKGKTQHDG